MSLSVFFIRSTLGAACTLCQNLGWAALEAISTCISCHWRHEQTPPVSRATLRDVLRGMAANADESCSSKSRRLAWKGHGAETLAGQEARAPVWRAGERAACRKAGVMNRRMAAGATVARHQHSPSSRERRHGATWGRRQRDLHHKTAQGGTRSHNREVWGSTPAARMGRPGPARRTAVDANAKPILAVRSIAPRRANCGASHEHRRRARTSCTAARPDGWLCKGCICRTSASDHIV